MSILLKKRKKVLVAMSGGVDSSVAAYFLKKSGYEVFGAFIHSFNLDGCEKNDILDAQTVAHQLNIPFYVFDFEKDYRKKVIDYMIKEYSFGLTPNPDVMCNKEIKFGLFLNKAEQLGMDFIATGHYVRLKNKKYKNKRIYSLYQAKDLNKDQSYFLWTLNQNQLSKCLFPLGNYLKEDVRKIAKELKLINALKKDSQGICFLGKISLKDFLKEYLPIKKGLVININNNEIIGEHEGVWFYTLGQRHLKLLKIYSRKLGQSRIKPLYVIDKDFKNNILIVGENNEDILKKYSQNEINFKEENINLIYLFKIKKNKKIKVLFRIRYRQILKTGFLLFEKSKIKLISKDSVNFVTPGQSIVFYSPFKELIGGGIITK